jgi:hypothetical protein
MQVMRMGSTNKKTVEDRKEKERKKSDVYCVAVFTI